MPATPAPPDGPAGRAQRTANWLRDGALALTAVLLVLSVAAAGWSASFISLHTFAVAHMGLSPGPAWLVPGTFDGAALGLSLLAFRAATHGRASLGARVYVYGFTALSSWINYIHIPDPQGRVVACLLPIAAVVVFDKLLKEARAAYERRHGREAFRVRPGLLALRLLIDRDATRHAIKQQITAIPVEALIGLGAGNLARAASQAKTAHRPAAPPPSGPRALDPILYPAQSRPVLPVLAPFTPQANPFARISTLPPGANAASGPRGGEDEHSAARRLHAEGMSYGQIAAALGRSKSWVHGVVNTRAIQHTNGN